MTYTAFHDGLPGRAFDPASFDIFPPDWLAEVPGDRLTSILLQVQEETDETRIAAAVDGWFVGESLATAHVLEGDATVAGDFRIDPAGHMRFAVFTRPTTGTRRIGRIVQRLCEIETYKTMSMLGFSRARSLSGDMGRLDSALTALIGNMQSPETPPDETLTGLLAISAEVEGMSARAAFRFGATGAYEAIVKERVTALRETRFSGRQTFGEFMMRRYDPAMRTVQATERRLAAMSDRAIRAGELLRTRVDVDRSAQNQALLESMDRRADAQLQLQKTVEGLSVVAISYYAVSLAGYLAYPFAEALGLGKGMLLAMLTPPVVAAVWWSLWRVHARLH